MWQQNLASIRIRICIGLVFNVGSKYASCICHFFVKKPTPDQHWPKMLNPAPPIKNWIRHPGMNISGTVLVEQETCSSRGDRPARRSQQSSPHQPAQPQEPWTLGILEIRFFIITYFITTESTLLGQRYEVSSTRTPVFITMPPMKTHIKKNPGTWDWSTFYKINIWLIDCWTTEFYIIDCVSASCLGWQRYLNPSVPFPL